jgi:hypothetical protein
MVPPELGRAPELIELNDALREGRETFLHGSRGRANLEICRAILTSAGEGREIALSDSSLSGPPGVRAARGPRINPSGHCMDRPHQSGR